MDILPFRPTLLDVPISYFEYDRQRDTFGNVPAQQTTLRRMGMTKFYRPPIEAIRFESDKAIQDTLKKQLPAFTPVAWLYHRRRDTSFAQKIRQQWPLLMGDVDQKDNPRLNMAELKKHLARLPYILLCAYSVRGGLWFITRLPDEQTPETLAAHFRYLQKLFSHKFGVKLDSTKGGNPTDLRFVSYDSDPYVNENATVMVGVYTPPPPKPRTVDYSRSNGEDESKLLTRLVRFTESAGEGERHATLLKASKLAGGFVAAGRMDEQTAIYALETVASEWPTFSKSQKTIRDGIRYGQATPVYPDSSYERETYGRTQPLLSQNILLTAKPPISTLAVSSNTSESFNGEIETSATGSTSKSNDKVVERIEPIVSLIVTSTVDDILSAPPGTIIRPDPTKIETLVVEPQDFDNYPTECDEVNPLNTIPQIKQQSFFEWQRSCPPFNQLGLASLNKQINTNT
ncbi:hypothetical protein GO755_36015 [Spirosoma sp. HMF4905]|uniref:Uncharacterized protein n=1 Tax=Spirosoma arboris TaxID=2682092 RepID=A0A7K1SNU4_9BACT|nr:BT4734/BF3469 family protein [Spirosoma arboris]MVM35484.1 hypothetical protein [Spirosoma arboris]